MKKVVVCAEILAKQRGKTTTKTVECTRKPIFKQSKPSIYLLSHFIQNSWNMFTSQEEHDSFYHIEIANERKATMYEMLAIFEK